jgi:hypothetical protein
MATELNNISRRALLGTFAAGSTLAIGSAASASLMSSTSMRRHEWDNAMTLFLKAKLAHDTYHSRVWEPAYAMEEVNEIKHGLGLVAGKKPANYWERRRAIPDLHRWLTAEISEKTDQLSNEYSDAESHLLTLEAPDIEAMLWKLESVWREESDPCENLKVRLIADARRLMGNS